MKKKAEGMSLRETFAIHRRAARDMRRIARDDLVVAVGHFPHRQGLNDAVDGNGIRQSLELRFIEVLPGLIRVGLYLVDGQKLVGAFLLGLFAEIPQQRA